MTEKGKKAPPDEIALECGKRVAECRRECGMTQQGLSKATGYRPRRSGLSPSQISNFEQGTRRIRFEEAEVLASVFTGYPSAYFMNAINKREAKLLIALRSENNSLPKTG